MTIFSDMAGRCVRPIRADERVFNLAAGKIRVGALAKPAGSRVQVLMEFTIAVERHSWEAPSSSVGERTYRKPSSQTTPLFGALPLLSYFFFCSFAAVSSNGDFVTGG